MGTPPVTPQASPQVCQQFPTEVKPELVLPRTYPSARSTSSESSPLQGQQTGAGQGLGWSGWGSSGSWGSERRAAAESTTASPVPSSFLSGPPAQAQPGPYPLPTFKTSPGSSIPSPLSHPPSSHSPGNQTRLIKEKDLAAVQGETNRPEGRRGLERSRRRQGCEREGVGPSRRPYKGGRLLCPAVQRRWPARQPPSLSRDPAQSPRPDSPDTQLLSSGPVSRRPVLTGEPWSPRCSSPIAPGKPNRPQLPAPADHPRFLSTPEQPVPAFWKPFDMERPDISLLANCAVGKGMKGCVVVCLTCVHISIRCYYASASVCTSVQLCSGPFSPHL